MVTVKFYHGPVLKFEKTFNVPPANWADCEAKVKDYLLAEGVFTATQLAQAERREGDQ